MSTFKGRMREYTRASLDRFDGKNLESTAYFLSHNHADHTVGLDTESFARRLQSSENFKLYTSPITKDLLLAERNGRYSKLRSSIVALELDQPTVVKLYEDEGEKMEQLVTVTFLHAGHCPGSVMILFEGDEGCVLYTGDFRLQKKHLEGMACLHSGTKIKEMKSLYIDTTFLVPGALYIPTREDSAKAVVEVCSKWIKQGDNHHVVISHKANLGYEQLYTELSQSLSTKVHVCQQKYLEYSMVGNLCEYVSPDPANTQIHACSWKNRASGASQLPCGYKLPENEELQICTIRVSTMAFVQNIGRENWAKRYNDHYFHICYSFHCSYSEIRETVLYLQPERAFANVEQKNEKIQHRLDRFVELAKQTAAQKLESTPSVKPLSTLKRKRKCKVLKLSQVSTSSENFDFGDGNGAKPKKAKTEFSHLFGGGDKEEEEKCLDTKEDRNSECDAGEGDGGKVCDDEEGSADELFSDEDYQMPDSYLLEEDMKEMKDFTPCGSIGEYMGYMSEGEEEEMRLQLRLSVSPSGLEVDISPSQDKDKSDDVLDDQNKSEVTKGVGIIDCDNSIAAGLDDQSDSQATQYLTPIKNKEKCHQTKKGEKETTPQMNGDIDCSVSPPASSSVVGSNAKMHDVGTSAMDAEEDGIVILDDDDDDCEDNIESENDCYDADDSESCDCSDDEDCMNKKHKKLHATHMSAAERGQLSSISKSKVILYNTKDQSKQHGSAGCSNKTLPNSGHLLYKYLQQRSVGLGGKGGGGGTVIDLTNDSDEAPKKKTDGTYDSDSTVDDSEMEERLMMMEAEPCCCGDCSECDAMTTDSSDYIDLHCSRKTPEVFVIDDDDDDEDDDEQKTTDKKKTDQAAVSSSNCELKDLKGPTDVEEKTSTQATAEMEADTKEYDNKEAVDTKEQMKKNNDSKEAENNVLPLNDDDLLSDKDDKLPDSKKLHSGESENEPDEEKTGMSACESIKGKKADSDKLELSVSEDTEAAVAEKSESNPQPDSDKEVAQAVTDSSVVNGANSNSLFDEDALLDAGTSDDNISECDELLDVKVPGESEVTSDKLLNEVESERTNVEEGSNKLSTDA